MSTRLCPDHNEILIDGEECGSCKAELDALPATPAPESPAPAPVPYYADPGLAPGGIPYHPEWDRKSPYVGTGSETSPDAARLRKMLAAVIESQALLARWIVPDSDLDDRAVLSALLGILDDQELVEAVRALLAKPAEQREAEQIPHPVAEAEQSPLPAGDEQAARLVSLMVDYLETDKFMSIPVPETSLGWLAAAKTWLAQAPTRIARKGK